MSITHNLRINYKTLSQLICFLILVGGTLFLSSDLFVDRETAPKTYVFIFISFILGIISILINKNKEWKIDLLSSIFIFFLSFLFVRNQFNFPLGLNSIILISCIFLYIYFRRIIHRQNILSVFQVFIVIGCTLQAVYGILQYTDIISISSDFPVIGSFDNPAGFAGCLAVGFPFGLFMANEKGWKKYLSIIFLFISSVTIVISESRAAIIAIVCCGIFFLCYTYNDLLKKYRKSIIISISILVIALFIALIFLKKNSASGRLLIWQVSTDMIIDNPWFGKKGNFKSEYMEYQANHFSLSPDSQFQQLADNAVHPFNEYLYIAIEYGLIGLILFLSLLVIAVYYNINKLSPYLVCLLSIVILSLFTYPFRYSFIWVIFILSLSQLSVKTPILFRLNKRIINPIRVFLLILFPVSLYILIKDIKFECRWKRVSQSTLLYDKEDTLVKYKELYENWNGNPLFLYNYGATLNYVKMYSESIEILSVCQTYFNDYDVQMILADNYFNTADWNNAEIHYKTASNMCPNRFLPLYQLVLVYEKTDNTPKALEIMDIILNKPIKIKSPTITKILLNTRKKKREINELQAENEK